MKASLADLDGQLLLLIAQHLILSSSIGDSSNDHISGPPSTAHGGTKNNLTHSGQLSALHSRVNINSLLNSNPDPSRQHTPQPVVSPKQCVESRSRPRPVYLLPLLLTCRRIYTALSVEGNPTLYKWLYEISFDTSAVKRRWNRSFLPSWHFQDTQASSREPELMHRDGKRRRSENAHIPHFGVSGSPTSHFRISAAASFTADLDFENNHSLFAEEYRERMRMFRRIRALNDLQDESSPDTQPPSVSGEEDMQIVHDLWMMWWMVTEHGMYSLHSYSVVTKIPSTLSDEKNIPLLREMTCLDQCFKPIHDKVYLSDVLSPGFPPSTLTKALLAWLALRLGLAGFFEDTPEHVDEKAFALTPYALASFKVCATCGASSSLYLSAYCRYPVPVVYRTLDFPSFTPDEGGGIRGRIASVMQAKRIYAGLDAERAWRTRPAFRTRVESSSKVSFRSCSRICSPAERP